MHAYAWCDVTTRILINIHDVTWQRVSFALLDDARLDMSDVGSGSRARVARDKERARAARDKCRASGKVASIVKRVVLRRN